MGAIIIGIMTFINKITCKCNVNMKGDYLFYLFVFICFVSEINVNMKGKFVFDFTIFCNYHSEVGNWVYDNQKRIKRRRKEKTWVTKSKTHYFWSFFIIFICVSNGGYNRDTYNFG